MWIMVLLLPVMVLVMGLMFRLKPPKRKNFFYGFRTQRSMASQEAWDAAHRMGGQLWIIAGLVLIIVSTTALLIFPPESPGVLFGIYALSFIGIFVPFGIVQHRLKKMSGE